MSVGGGTESWGLGVGEVSLHMDERGNTLVILMAPNLAHEGSVEIGLAAQQRIDSGVAQEFRKNDDLSGSVEDRV